MFEVRLAPMCGITDHIFRSLCYEQGCDLAYTEMISAIGYLCAPEQRAVKELMLRGEKEPRLIIQLFGRAPGTVAEAAKRICELGIYDVHGQPLPGVLITLLLGAAFGLTRKLRNGRRNAHSEQTAEDVLLLTARLLRMQISYLYPPETIHTISPGPDLFCQRE